MRTDELFPRTRNELGAGAVHIPDWLELDAQVELVRRCREWSRGPAGLRTPRMPDGTPLSIRSVCLGWHWYPYAYSRTCDDHDGAPVKPLPPDIVALAMDAAVEAGYHRGDLRFDASIVNIYDASSKLGLHQDSAEGAGTIAAGHPVVTISLGDTCIFRFGNNDDPHASVDRRRTAQWRSLRVRRSVASRVSRRRADDREHGAARTRARRNADQHHGARLGARTRSRGLNPGRGLGRRLGPISLRP